ncbi:hypothetical protein F2Q69_00035569 [Brassica cretica]|uniref:Uncharacterized protein n=1 Tax=Brassica cretica TaxID=69181 RepID=A0A8S9SMU9_BRACR|nr:hypothetical protein F2Q69_00035569 [Brassica cretica]
MRSESATPLGHHHHSWLLTARRERVGWEREIDHEEREREREVGSKEREKRESRWLGIPGLGNSLQGFDSTF